MLRAMRGVIFDGKRAEIVDDLEVREPEAGEVRVRIQAAGLCHSDLLVLEGAIPYPAPVVMGHEGAGVVDAVGPGVTHPKVGDRVVLSTIRNCGRCESCSRGRPTHCLESFGRVFQPFQRGGEPVYNFAATSVFCDYTLVDAVQAVVIPDALPPAAAALVGCAVLTGVGAVLNRARVEAGERVAVIGAGGIGLNAIQGSRLAGAQPIVAIDTNPAKEEVARRFGATHFLSETGDALKDALNEVSPLGVDYVFECVGAPGLVKTATTLLDRGGNVVVLGVPPPGTEASFDVGAMYQDKGVLMCRYGGSRPQHDVLRYAELYADGRLLLDELVTRTYPLEDFHRAVADLNAGELARGVFEL